MTRKRERRRRDKVFGLKHKFVRTPGWLYQQTLFLFYSDSYGQTPLYPFLLLLSRNLDRATHHWPAAFFPFLLFFSVTYFFFGASEGRLFSSTSRLHLEGFGERQRVLWACLDGGLGLHGLDGLDGKIGEAERRRTYVPYCIVLLCSFCSEGCAWCFFLLDGCRLMFLW